MKRVKMPATIDSLEDMLDYIINGLSGIEADKKLINQIRLSCEEVLVNVISYAYQDTAGYVEITCEISKDKGEVFIQFVDEGMPYNPLLNTDPDIDAPIEDRSIGGLGVYLYKTIMDKVTYERKDEKNILTFIKKLERNDQLGCTGEQ